MEPGLPPDGLDASAGELYRLLAALAVVCTSEELEEFRRLCRDMADDGVDRLISEDFFTLLEVAIYNISGEERREWFHRLSTGEGYGPPPAPG